MIFKSRRVAAPLMLAAQVQSRQHRPLSVTRTRNSAQRSLVDIPARAGGRGNAAAAAFRAANGRPRHRRHRLSVRLGRACRFCQAVVSDHDHDALSYVDRKSAAQHHLGCGTRSDFQPVSRSRAESTGLRRRRHATIACATSAGRIPSSGVTPITIPPLRRRSAGHAPLRPHPARDARARPHGRKYRRKQAS